MPHWRSLMEPTEYYGKPKLMSFNQVDAQERALDVTYKILEVKAGEVVDQKKNGAKIKKPILILLDRNKKEWSFPVNVTISKVLEKLYGGDVKNWAGKLMTLFVTTTSVSGEDVYCLRVRPSVPQSKGDKGAAAPNDRTEPPAETPSSREPGEEG